MKNIDEQIAAIMPPGLTAEEKARFRANAELELANATAKFQPVLELVRKMTLSEAGALIPSIIHTIRLSTDAPEHVFNSWLILVLAVTFKEFPLPFGLSVGMQETRIDKKNGGREN